MTVQQPADIQLRQVLNMLVRRRRLIIAMGLAGALLAGIVGFTLPAKYTAKAQLVVEPPQAAAIGIAMGAAGVVDEMAIETHVTMITTRDHLRRVREILVARSAGTGGSAQVGPAAGGLTGQSILPTVEQLEVNLRVYQERKGRAIAVTYTATNAQDAATIANHVARLYAERQAGQQSTDRRSILVEQQVTALNHQLAMARSDLAARQARLTAVRDLQRQGGGNARIVESLAASVSSESQRDLMALLQSKTELAAAAPGAQPGVQSAAVKLQDVQQKIDREVDRIVTQLDEEAQIASSRVRSLQQRLETLQVAGSQVRGLDASRESQRGAVSGQRPEGSLRPPQEMVDQGEILPSVRILALASPPVVPSTPNPLLFIFPALVVFAIGGGFLAMVAEGLDRGLRSERDVVDALGLPCLALVPEVARPRSLLSIGDQEPQPPIPQLMLQDPFSPYADAIRSVVGSALQLNAPDQASRVFLVTSCAPGDGKTTLAVSFAAYAARLGRRVLLLDLDCKNPSIQRELGDSAANGGLLDVLNGRPVEDVVQHSAELGFDYLPLADLPVDPMTVLATGRLPDLLQQFRESYECVVVDGPELVGSAEARLLIPMLDRVLLAVRWHTTPREMAQHAVSLLRGRSAGERDPATFASAVVTRVDLKQHARYRYGDVAAA